MKTPPRHGRRHGGERRGGYSAAAPVAGTAAAGAGSGGGRPGGGSRSCGGPCACWPSLALSAFGALLDEGVSSRLGLRLPRFTLRKAATSAFRRRGVDEAAVKEIVVPERSGTLYTGRRVACSWARLGPQNLLARATAGKAGVLHAPRIEEMYVGVGARRVRDLFDAVTLPVHRFIDEIDAIGASRHLKEQQAMKMTLNQL